MFKGKLVEMPFSTFGSLVDAGWTLKLYCPGCYRTVPLKVTDELRPQMAFHRRFRCKQFVKRWTAVPGYTCNALGHLEIEPPRLLYLPPNSPVERCHLYCGGVPGRLPRWQIYPVKLGEAPWPPIHSDERYKCPGCGAAVGWSWSGGNVPGTDGYKPYP